MSDHEYECKPIGNGVYQVTVNFEFPKLVDGRMAIGTAAHFYGKRIGGVPFEPSEDDFPAAMNLIRLLESKCAAVQ
jgi:hypothetical protein